jgi:chromosome segregation ATPase
MDYLLRQLDHRLTKTESDVSALRNRIRRLEWKMAKDKEALARLDEQIEALRNYVMSDEETDAAEVDRRTESLRQLLAEAQGSGQVTPEEAGEVENQLGQVLDEANQQTGGENPSQ